ncbi:hypothetical protein [Shimia sagamensis]|uniref:Uncharacterized protein n=1 Tax=Shimia sagamensis TaxID=1566352 RepID=A0ABY1PE10_9RHOB|nr:hypothetical protein [Shimia sagamensis]SMP32129.1 hypothetical protein SAMN06265373_108133 [Shimia sagamensis]
MSDENQTVVDLFGNERYLTPRTKGRPAFEWTEENSNKVSMLLAMGWSNDRIAGCVLDPRTGKPISVPTLKRHFRSELKVRAFARDRLLALRLMQTFDQAENGNVGAQRLFDQMVARNDLMSAEDRVKNRAKDNSPPKPVALGKKEQNAFDAEEAEARLSEELKGEAGAARPN